MMNHNQFNNNISTRMTCLSDSDCSRYVKCELANGCKCQLYGECLLVRAAGQPCQNNLQCASGLFCRDTDAESIIERRCFPINNYLEDLPMFADLPDPDQGSQPGIPPSYVDSFLVAFITVFLVVSCLCIGAWYRFTYPSSNEDPVDIPMVSPSSVLIERNYNQPLSNYASTSMCEVHGCSSYK